MKKKLLSIVLSVVMIASLLVPMFVISAADGPAATISLGTPVILEGRDFDEDGVVEAEKLLGIPVLVSDNNDEFFTARYQVLSENGLNPYFASGFVDEDGNPYDDEGFDEGNFTKKVGKNWISFINTVKQTPEGTDKKGFQVLHDSDGGTKGISAAEGTLITVYFEFPTAPGTYTFTLVWLDGTDEVSTQYTMTVNPATVSYNICPGHTGGEATCKDKAVCSVCNTAYGELAPTNHKGQTEVRGAVSATCNTPGYTGDTYCLDCNQKIEDGTPIAPTNEHVDANGKWETNGTQHFHTCTCGEIIDAENHKGGEATCKDKAVCSVCNTAYGEIAPANHKGQTEVRDYAAASCNTPGYTGDIYCRDCNQKIEDGTPIAPTNEHVDANGKWETNGTQHFHTCTCGEIIDAENHTGGEATCKDKAVCSVCNTAYGELAPTNHKGQTEVRGAVGATCITPGYTGDTYCLDCNQKKAAGAPIPANGQHRYDNGTKLDRVCGQKSAIRYECICDENCTHFKVVEGAVIEHDWEYSEALSVEPKCGVPGKDVYVCKNANCPEGSYEVILDALEHDYDYDYYDKMIDVVAPTKDAMGSAKVPCRHGCGTTKNIDLEKLTDKVETGDGYISSDDAILPEDIDISINDANSSFKDGKVEVEFTFSSNIITNLEGAVEFALDITEAKKEFTNFKAYVLNSDNTKTLVSEIVGDKLIIKADLKDTLVLSYEEIPEKEDEKSPVTGDSMNVAVLAVLALSAIAGLVVVGKKRFAL